MSQAVGTPATWNRSVNMFVPSAQFSADVDQDGMTKVDWGAPVAANATGILAAQSIAAGATLTASDFDAAYADTSMGTYGRNVVVVASGAATSKIGVYGRDYLGQPLYEQFTLNGATTVQGKKAFASVSKVIVETTTAATTADVGWGDKLGIPYRAVALISSLEDGVTATAGTLTTGASASTTQTGTSNDPRGLFDPNSATDGTKTFGAVVIVDQSALYGIAHFTQ